MALPPIDMTLHRGERLAICGPNGSGKTTLLRCVVGSLLATGGRLAVGGHPGGSIEARRLTGCALIGEGSFASRLTGFQELEFHARLRHADAGAARRDCTEIIDELDLEDIVRRAVSGCSTGMLGRLAVARALIGGPALLVLDEPTRSLDDAAVELVWRAIDRRPSMAVIVATHTAVDAAACGARLDLVAPCHD